MFLPALSSDFPVHSVSHPRPWSPQREENYNSQVGQMEKQKDFTSLGTSMTTSRFVVFDTSF
jgi:hypothetical protein